VVHRTVSGAPGWLLANWPLSGIHRRRTTIIHRTVRPPAQRSATKSARDAWPQPTVGWGHRTVRCAPDCPVCTRQCPVCTGQCPVRQPARRSNGRLRQEWKEIRTGHATVAVRCATRQKARIAFLVGFQQLLAALGL
jgi:hypothetical protein